MLLIQMQMKFQFGVALGSLIDESPVDRYRCHPPSHQFPGSSRNNGNDGRNEQQAFPLSLTRSVSLIACSNRISALHSLSLSLSAQK